MDKHQHARKSLVQSLHDRSGRQPRIRRLNSRDTIISHDYFDDILQRIERLESEMIRYNKVLTMYIDRIEDLENSVDKLCKQLKTVTVTNVNPDKNNVGNDNNNSKSDRNKVDSIKSNSSSTSTTTTVGYASTNISGDGSVSGNVSQKLSTWMRFTKFFRHRPSLDTLKKKNIYQNEPCFDTEIENVIKHERHRTIPKIVVECIELIENKIKITPIDGLYRTSGNYVEIQKLRFLIDSNDYNCLKQVNDIHTIVGVLKLFFREIKSPLIRTSEIRAFIGTSSRDWTLSSITYKIDILQKLVKTLPEINRDTLSYFLKHLCRLTRTPLQFVNARSLALSLTPTVFHTTSDYRCDIHVTMKESEILANCLEIMIEYCDKIFELPYKRVSRRLTKCISCPKLNI